MLTIRGNKLLAEGDMHIEDIYRGQHVNYQENSYWCMQNTLDLIKQEKPDLYVNTGDFIGVRNNVARLEDRVMLRRTAQWLEDMKIPRIINTGNHDMFGNDHTNDYLLLSSLRYFYTPDQIADDNGNVVRLVSEYLDEDGKPFEIYVHFVKYGDEFKKLNPVKDAVNVAITHNDFKVGALSYTQNPDAIDLVEHEPFFGMDVIVNGHIHNPSSRETFKTRNGMDCTFINVGSKARPKRSEDYNKVFYVIVGIRLNALGKPEPYFRESLIELKPADEIFISKTSSETLESTLKTDLEDDGLGAVLDVLKDFNWSGVSMVKRVEALSIEPAVKELIFEYLETT